MKRLFLIFSLLLMIGVQASAQSDYPKILECEMQSKILGCTKKFCVYLPAGYGEEDLKAKFGALYTAFSYGAPPHAGMAPGVDRMVMLIAGEETIRDVIAFPLNGNAQDLMMGAPGEVTELQLREVHIKVRD